VPGGYGAALEPYDVLPLDPLPPGPADSWQDDDSARRARWAALKEAAKGATEPEETVKPEEAAAQEEAADQEKTADPEETKTGDAKAAKTGDAKADGITEPVQPPPPPEGDGPADPPAEQ
jgi:hypothetical protein